MTWRVSGERLLFNPDLSLASDQYGGLGLTSAPIYRYLSPDAHRPFLMLILGSLFFALGVPFLWQAAHLRLPARAAAPGSLDLRALPGRDFLHRLADARAVPAWLERGGAVGSAGLAGRIPARRWRLWSFSLAGMLFFATRSALFVIGVLALLFWLDFTAARSGQVWKWLGWAGLALGALAAVYLTWDWFRWASVWDQVLTLRNSGMVARILDRIGDRYRIPFIVGLRAGPTGPAGGCRRTGQPAVEGHRDPALTGLVPGAPRCWPTRVSAPGKRTTRRGAGWCCGQ